MAAFKINRNTNNKAIMQILKKVLPKEKLEYVIDEHQNEHIVFKTSFC